MTKRGGKLGFNAAWSMAVGGMIGGGIFATLGVVIAVAGKLAWLSFVIGGLIALATGYSYARLTQDFDCAGGAFAFLRRVGAERAARVTVWALMLGYTLTVSVYAFTFGAYLAHAVGGPSWLPQVAALLAIFVLAGVNLKGSAKVRPSRSSPFGASWRSCSGWRSSASPLGTGTDGGGGQQRQRDQRGYRRRCDRVHGL